MCGAWNWRILAVGGRIETTDGVGTGERGNVGTGSGAKAGTCHAGELDGRWASGAAFRGDRGWGSRAHAYGEAESMPPAALSSVLRRIREL